MFKISLTILALAGAGAFFIRFTHSPKAPVTAALNYLDYSREIDSLGAKSAYAKFQKETALNPSSEQRHRLAHEFGLALYEKSGLDGIGVCGQEFDFGCYHSFLSAAILDHGLTIAGRLDEICNQQFGADDVVCQHGIGHGLVGHVGYKPPDLLQVLQICKTLSSKGPLAGCKSGAFMEYNQQTLHALSVPGTPAGRPLDSAGPHAPCRQAPEEFIPACYSEQPHWWKAVFNWDFKKIGELCGEAGTEKLVEICVRSLGYSLKSNYDDDTVLITKACQSMPDKQKKFMCLDAAGLKFP